MSLPATRLTFDRDRFTTPLATDRPGVRWWWQSPVPVEELLRELRVIAAAGFGEVEIAFSPGFWADDAQRDALGAVLEEAEMLGVGVASTLGAAWPLQTPNTAAGTDHAAQELQYGVQFLEPGFEGSVTVPLPFDDQEGARRSRLVAVTAARVITRGPGPEVVTVQDWSGTKSEIHAPDVSTLLDAESLVDLTPDVTDDTVSVRLGRAGEWAVFAFWMRDTAQGVTSFIDRAAAVAATTYLDEHQIGDKNGALLRRAGTELFEDSLELNADSLFWAPDVLDRFRALHGYDLTIYLPVLFAQGMCRYWVPDEVPVPDFDLDSGDGFRIRQDYYRLLTELYITDHLLVLQEWAAKYGLAHKAQVAYGQNLEPVRSNREFVRNGGRAEAESLNSGDRTPISRDHHSWRFALDWQRALVGGAHQGGATRISTELGAQFLAGYMFTLGDYKQMLDKEWAAGITKPFLHGFASQRAGADWPTQSRFFHGIADSWNDRTFPEWPNWPALTDYWARGTVALESGTPRTDVAIYRDGFLTTAARGLPDQDLTAPQQLVEAEPLEDAGYTIQFIDPIGITDPQARDADPTLYPHGPAYQALIIDERAISVDAAEALVSAARTGFRVVVVGTPPAEDSGFAAGTDGAPRVQAAVSELLALPSVTQAKTMRDVPDALGGLGVIPRVRLEGGKFLTQLRTLADGAIVLAYNTTDRSVRTRVTVNGHGTLSELDLRTGTTCPVLSLEQGARTAADLTFGPLELRILRLSTTDTEHVEAEVPREWEELPVSGWSLTVHAAGPELVPDIRVPGQGPADWRTIEPLRYASGTGIYSVEVITGDATRFAVDLGELAGSAVVIVGGKRFGPALESHTHLDLGDALRSHSQVSIEVRTPLRNATIDHGVLDAAYSPTRATGLIGPVRFLGESPNASEPRRSGRVTCQHY